MDYKIIAEWVRDLKAQNAPAIWPVICERVKQEFGREYHPEGMRSWFKREREKNPGVKIESPGEAVLQDREVRRLRANLHETKRKYHHALEMLEQAERRFDTLLALKENQHIPIITPDPAERRNQAAAVVIYSDWHIEERVDPKTVNGINEYNPDIAEKRARLCFENTLKLVKKERQNTVIDRLVLLWLGDFISGHIHEEFVQSNYMTPIEATRFAKRLLASGLNFLTDFGDFRQITVICQPGNHGRTTTKIYSVPYRNSYEWLMYCDLAEYFDSRDNIRFVVSESTLTYIDIFGHTIRAFHGDNFRYYGGIGGITIPLVKYLHRANQQKQADMNFLGHWHQMIEPTKDCNINGSLIGFSPYAQKIGAAPERPQQLFRLLDQKRGFTVKAPILVE